MSSEGPACAARASAMDHPSITPPPQESPVMAADRLSDLPDDLLRRILYFAPAREGASTAVLSRRWPGLWATSSAVNLDTRSYDRAHAGGDIFDKREPFLRGAAAALAHARGPVRRLAVDVVTQNPNVIHNFLHYSPNGDKHDMLAGVLPNPAAQRVEELRISAAAASDGEFGHYHGNFYELSFGTLPSVALRVLHITNCSDLAPPPPGAVFPQLAEVKLVGCTTSVTGLQGMIAAAPQLAGMHLERTQLVGGLECSGEETKDGSQIMIERYRFRCPTITALVLAECGWPKFLDGSVELDMPMLRYFKYHGLLHQFSLKSKAPNMTRADLHFTDDGGEYQIRKCRLAFWQFVQNFDNAKFLKLELENPIEFIAIVGNKKQQEIMAGKLLSNLERLELKGCYEPASSKNTAVAIANLLHCCPVISDLRIKLSKKPPVDRSILYRRSFIQRKTRLDFDKSIDHFRRRRSPAMISFGGDDHEIYEVSDIPSLSAHLFNCLQKYVRRVSLRFPFEDRNCFGVQLTKFFAENALLLEEMYVGDGRQKMCEHINRRVETWIVNSSKRRVSACHAGFTVLPLET